VGTSEYPSVILPLLFTLSVDFVCMLHCYESWLSFITLLLYCVIQLSWVITVRQ